MLFVGTSIIHPSTEGVFLLCNILDLLIYSYQEIRRGITRSCKKLVFFPEHPQKIWTECPIGVIIQTLDIVALPCPYPGFSKRGGNRNPAEHQPEKSQSNFWSSFFKEDKIKWLER